MENEGCGIIRGTPGLPAWAGSSAVQRAGNM